MGHTPETRKRAHAKVRQRRVDFLNGKSCVKCGSIEDLEVDHIDPSTKDHRLKTGTGLWSWAKERRERELAKCQVLCHKCHKLKSIEEDRLRADPKHGTLNMYNGYGCRCYECVQEKARYKQVYYKRTRDASII